MTADTAGVDSKPSLPIQILPTPFAAAMRQMTGIAVSEKYLPSPDTTSVEPDETKADETLTRLRILCSANVYTQRSLIGTFEVISRQRVECSLHEVLQVMLLLEDLDLQVALPSVKHIFAIN